MSLIVALAVAAVGFLFVRGLASAHGAAPPAGGPGDVATRTRVIVPSVSTPPLPTGPIGPAYTSDTARAIALEMKAQGYTQEQVLAFLDGKQPPPPGAVVGTAAPPPDVLGSADGFQTRSGRGHF